MRLYECYRKEFPMDHKNNSIPVLLCVAILQFCCADRERWSPESSDLLFMSNRDGNSEIYLKRGSDTTWINLSMNEAGDNWAVWSPDGNNIAFQSRRSGNLDIWLMNNDGSNPTQLTSNNDHDYLPAFTPDGKKITFTSWRKEKESEERAPHIYIMNSDGTDQRRLVDESINTSAGASWHPNGEKFLFTKKVGKTGADIFEADKNGKVLRQLTNDTLYSSGAQYSPNGSHIVYTQDYGYKTEIIIMNVDGSNSKVLLKDGQNYYPHWSPDGKWITYTSIVPNSEDQDIDIYAISVDDTSKQILLARSEKREAEGVWNPVLNRNR